MYVVTFLSNANGDCKLAIQLCVLFHIKVKFSKKLMQLPLSYFRTKKCVIVKLKKIIKVKYGKQNSKSR